MRKALSSFLFLIIGICLKELWPTLMFSYAIPILIVSIIFVVLIEIVPAIMEHISQGKIYLCIDGHVLTKNGQTIALKSDLQGDHLTYLLSIGIRNEARTKALTGVGFRLSFPGPIEVRVPRNWEHPTYSTNITHIHYEFKGISIQHGVRRFAGDEPVQIVTDEKQPIRIDYSIIADELKIIKRRFVLHLNA